MELSKETKAVLKAQHVEATNICNSVLRVNWEQAYNASAMLTSMHTMFAELKPYLYLFHEYKGTHPTHINPVRFLLYGNFLYALWVEATLCAKPPVGVEWLREAAEAFYNATSLSDYRCIMTPRSYHARGCILHAAQSKGQ